MGNSDYEVVGDDFKHGGFASVRRVKRRSDGKIFACKHLTFDTRLYSTRQNFRTRVEREIHLLNEVDHSNIVQYFEADWASDSTVMVYMEYVGGGNLSDYIEAKSRNLEWPSDDQAWSFIFQLSAALAYCHHGLYRISGARRSTKVVVMDWTQILHRDIKPRNVLLRHTSGGQVQYKLCDFGLSVLYSPTDDASISYCGTRGYIAPEITLDRADWSTKADVYSFGCKNTTYYPDCPHAVILISSVPGTLYYMVNKRAPPYNQHSTTSTVEVAESSFHAPHSIQSIMDACLRSTPKSRPDSKELLESSSRHVDKTILALATRHDSRPSSPTNETVTAILGKYQPVISNYVEAVPFRPSEHDSGASGQVGEAIPIPFGVHQRDIAQHSDKTDRDQAWMHEFDDLNHVDARIDTLVTELESKALSPIRATVPTLAMRHDSGNASGGKPESQATKPSFGSGSATKGSFLSSQVSEPGVSKTRGSSLRTTPVLHSQAAQNEVEAQNEHQAQFDAGWPLKTAPFVTPHQQAEQLFRKTSRLLQETRSVTSEQHQKSQERQEQQEQEERLERQERRKQHQEHSSVVLKPALKSVAQPDAARLPAKVHFQHRRIRPGTRMEHHEQRPTPRPGTVQLPASILFPDYKKDDSMTLRLTKSEKGFNVETSKGRPVFKVAGMRASSLNLNDTVLSFSGKHLVNLRQQGILLRTTLFGEDANGREVFKIKCPVTFNSLKAVGSFLNANGIKESLVMTGDYYGRKIDITDKKTGMCVARIRQRQRTGNDEPLVLSVLLVSPNVDCVLMTAMCLQAYKITYSRSRLRLFGN
ncbi:hypothetical protein PG984_007607 [Apiospora sp. TS-2023a]